MSVSVCVRVRVRVSVCLCVCVSVYVAVTVAVGGVVVVWGCVQGCACVSIAPLLIQYRVVHGRS